MSQPVNCLIAQSGGPTTAINASLAGIISAAQANPGIGTVFGSLHGIRGVLDHHIIEMKALGIRDDASLKQLKYSPAMYLGSCRYKLPPFTETEDDYKCIFETFREYGIRYFFYIGGNDSMDTVLKLSLYAEQIHSDVRIIGIPKTIDNDLPLIDHTPGYGSAAKYIASSMLEMAQDTMIYNTKSILIVEIMGRNAGWLTAASALARTAGTSAPHLIYLPERPFSKESFLRDIRSLLARQNHIVAAVSEGIRYEDGSYVSADTSEADQFGHVMLNGAGKCLESLVAAQIGCKVRSAEINILQRCAAHLASETDLHEAFLLGQKAVEAAAASLTGKMVILKRTSDQPYTVEYGYTDISEVANQEKTIPDSWIHPNGNDITDAFLDYALPLIQGEPDITYRGGLPLYLPVPHLELN